MSLISIPFAIFVLAAATTYYLFPQKYRWTVLLTASCIYYLIICNQYVLYMLITTVSTWLGACRIESRYQEQAAVLKAHKGEWSREQRKTYKAKITHRCRSVMLAVLFLNFGILGILKYSGFAAELLTSAAEALGAHIQFPQPHFLLPLGISFYTFQAMGYLIDVYQEKTNAERNLAKFALFVSFFPQIIQGPIAIYDDLAPQLYEPHTFSFRNLKNAAALILWGMFKKMVIADRAAVVIHLITENPDSFSGTFILAAALLYALQLYTDFSGGIDIVRGIGELFGITMADNFQRPYFSCSLTEYWHRWHITLGNWVRTYVFYPLSISRKFLDMGRWMQKHWGKHLGKVIPTSLASLITFLIIGIWHGANGKYVAFGLWNGLVIMLLEICRPLNEKIGNALHVNREGKLYHTAAVLWTFFLVLIGYYFDIARNFKDAMHMLLRSATDLHLSDIHNLSCLKPAGLDRYDYLVILAGAAIIFIVSVVQERSNQKIRDMLWQKSQVFQWIVFLGGMIIVMIFGYYGPHMTPTDFVYMQF